MVEQINNGTKNVELRLATNYWRKKLCGRTYDEIHLCLGYPKRGDKEKTLRRKWIGSPAKENVLHEEFGDNPVDVFVIEVGVETP
jgi:hypothetical protein